MARFSTVKTAIFLLSQFKLWKWRIFFETFGLGTWFCVSLTSKIVIEGHKNWIKLRWLIIFSFIDVSCPYFRCVQVNFMSCLSVSQKYSTILKNFNKFLLSFYVTTEFELQQQKRRRGVPYECIIKQLKPLWIFYCISIIAVSFTSARASKQSALWDACTISLSLSCN